MAFGAHQCMRMVPVVFMCARIACLSKNEGRQLPVALSNELQHGAHIRGAQRSDATSALFFSSGDTTLTLSLAGLLT